jgi:hypothetical protein
MEPANLPFEKLLMAYRVYNPNLTSPQLETSLSILGTQTPGAIQGVISTLMSKGFGPYIQNGIAAANSMAAAFSSNVEKPVSSISPQLYIPPPRGGGGGGWSCEDDAAAIFGAATVFLVLSVMTLGAVDVLAGGAWAGISLWGGIGTGTYTLGHTAKCSF